MRKLGIALTLGVLMAGTSAYAQVTNIQSSVGNTITAGSDSSPVSYPTPGTTPGGPPGATYDSFVHVNPTTIEFESSNTSSGNYVSSTSYSTVSFDVTNTTGQAATFGSTITAAGMGFYLADTSGGCLYTNCPQVDINNPVTFNHLNLSGNSEVGFDFRVTSQTAFGDAVEVYSLSATLGITQDGYIYVLDGLGEMPEGDFRGSGARSLNDFADGLGNDVTYDDNGHLLDGTALGYHWGATDFDFQISGASLQTLTYTTTVHSITSGACIGDTMICLVAYSGFGDPVGRGGGNQFARSLPRITGLDFTPTVFDIPTFENGVGSFRSAAVPEPATWLAMVLGFGLLGGALRRRRTLSLA